MVDTEIHKIIDMIDSRDGEAVTNWLKTFPNLQIFSRDGSITYRNAINQAHENNLQVSDRFRILKNLTDYTADSLKKELKNKILVNTSALKDNLDRQEELNQGLLAINPKLTLEEKHKHAFKCLEEGKTKI